jgi:hypothetical protein
MALQFSPVMSGLPIASPGVAGAGGKAAMSNQDMDSVTWSCFIRTR